MPATARQHWCVKHFPRSGAARAGRHPIGFSHHLGIVEAQHAHPVWRGQRDRKIRACSAPGGRTCLLFLALRGMGTRLRARQTARRDFCAEIS